MKAVTLWTSLLLLPCCSVCSYAKDKHPLQTATVVSQQIGSYNAGAAVMPMYGGLVGVPITRRSNVVIVETANSLMTWSEVGNKTIILPEGGKVSFYQDKDYFVIMDSRNKKHRFVLTHLEAKNGR
jgi:hypothetical protein